MGYDSAFDNLAKQETFRDRSPYGNKSAYGVERNPFQSRSPYENKNNDQNKQVNEKDKRKYLRFNDLKLLNEFMVHLANNTLPDGSRIDILSQGMLGEIKNILSSRIFKIAIIPALMSIVMALLFALSGYFILDAFGMLVYIAILIRVFYYPAKLYYSNIRYTTCLPAKTFFEEMSYWFKMSVFNTYGSMITVAILLFVLSFFQEPIINYFLTHIGHISSSLIHTNKITKYIANISFSISWKLFPLFMIFLLFLYAKFVSREKTHNEAIKEKILKEIRNETISTVRAIQEDR